MPIDFQQLYQRLREAGAGAQANRKTLEERRARARGLLERYAADLDFLRQTLEAARRIDPALRCALPLTEPLNFHAPPPDLPAELAFIAADGSQIHPDRHAALPFGLVNIAALTLHLHSGQPPQIFTSTRLLLEEELYTRSGAPLNEGTLALLRDLEERSTLETLAANLPPSLPAITVTDGPLELWGAAGGDQAREYEEALQTYLQLLQRLQQRQVITAGYVDKPSANPLLRLLEVIEAPLQEENFDLRSFAPLRGVSDRWLMGQPGRPLLPPGERSAVFQLQARSLARYSGGLSICFFYLNVSAEAQHPWPVRVEIPAWVAEDPLRLGYLHASLLEQCQALGARPYPYLLLRAHEAAVVSHEEKRQVEQLLALEKFRLGEIPDQASYKQSGKDALGQRRG